MKFISAILVCCILLSSEAIAQVIPDSTSIDSVYFGVKSFEFSSSSHDASVFTFYYYKPQSYNPATSPILFAIHGDQGSGTNEIVDLMNIAERRSALIVAPNFTTSGCMQEQVAIYALFDSTQVCYTYGPATEVMKAIYKHVLQRENRTNVPAYLIGFSAGGQFVTRYMLIRQTYPDSIPIKMAVSTNPAYYTFPTESYNGTYMPWACGLAFDSVFTAILPSLCQNAINFYNFKCNEHIVQYYNENYGVLIGTGDVQPYGAGCMLDQGANRYERAVNFYNFCDSDAVVRGTTLQWPYVEVPGVGHSQSQMYLSKVNATDTSTIAETLLFDTPYHATTYANPVISFYADTTLIAANGTVNFTNTSVNAINYLWDFGDNSTSTQTSPSHTYTVAGVYAVQLIGYDNTGCDGWAIKRNYIRVTGSIQGVAEKFQKTFAASASVGGRIYDAQQTADSGYVAYGTSSIASTNFYMVKFKSNGDTLWSRMYGGSGGEQCQSGQQTIDGGYILTGETTSFGTSDQDIYLVKTDVTVAQLSLKNIKLD